MLLLHVLAQINAHAHCTQQEFDELAVERVLCQQLVRTLINVHTVVIESGCHESHWKEFESHILLVVS